MYQNGFYQPDFNNQYYNPYQYNPWANQMRNNMVMQPQNNVQQEQPQNNAINGRFVVKPDDIAVNEVDMNGRVSIFPVNDMSCIYAKQWTADGKIKTVKYIPVQDEMPINANNASTQALQIDYTPIMDRLDKLEQLLTPRSNQRTKKGDAENE